MLTPNTVLQGRYLIEKVIGKGNMGAVYKAEDLRLNHIVAIKETFSNDDYLGKQFEREARILAKLRHPFLPRVTDHFLEVTGQFLVMDYIEGEDLNTVMQRYDKGVPVNVALKWADQVLEALIYLHSQNPPVIHRDIKPANLKLTPVGQIFLLDFGLAKGSIGASLFSLPAATPAYAPLEQMLHQGTDIRSDLYALGATLYHLMTKELPPSSLVRLESKASGLADPLQLASRINLKIPTEIASTLMKSMSLNVQERLATAGEMRLAFHNTVSHRGQYSDTSSSLSIKSKTLDTLDDPSTIIIDRNVEKSRGNSDSSFQVAVYAQSFSTNGAVANSGNFLVANLTTSGTWTPHKIEGIPPTHLMTFKTDVFGTVFSVCNGSGNAKEVASHHFVECIRDYMFELQASPTYSKLPFYERLRLSIELTNLYIFQLSLRQPEYVGMEAWFTTAAISGNSLYAAHCDFGSAYLLRYGKVFSLGVTNRSSVAEIEMQKVGSQANINVKVYRSLLCDLDILILCTPDITRSVAQSEMVEIIDKIPSLKDGCQAIIDAAKKVNRSGNFTVLLAQFTGGQLPPAQDNKVEQLFLPRDPRTPFEVDLDMIDDV